MIAIGERRHRVRGARVLAYALAASLGAPEARAMQEAAPPALAPAPAPAPAPGASADVAGAQPAQDTATPRFSVQIPPGPFRIGQRLELLVRGPFEPGMSFDAGTLPDGVELGTPELQEHPDGNLLRVPLRLTRDGTLRLESLTLVNGEQRDRLPAVRLDVELDSDAGRVPQVAAALPQLTLDEVPDWMRWTGAASTAALALLLLEIWRRRRRLGARLAPAPPRSPDLIAAEALARLRARPPRTHDEVPPFLQDVSHALRTWIEECFGVRAPESTTEEFLAVAAGGHPALAGHREALTAFLTQCDLVKFARLRPEPASALPLLATAESFVEATRALLSPTTTPAAPSEAAPAGAADRPGEPAPGASPSRRPLAVALLGRAVLCTALVGVAFLLVICATAPTTIERMLGGVMALVSAGACVVGRGLLSGHRAARIVGIAASVLDFVLVTLAFVLKHPNEGRVVQLGISVAVSATVFLVLTSPPVATWFRAQFVARRAANASERDAPRLAGAGA